MSQVFYALDDEGDTNPRLVIPSLNQAFDLVNTPVGTWVRFLRPGMSSKIALQVQRWMDARDRGCSLADAASYALQAKA